MGAAAFRRAVLGAAAWVAAAVAVFPSLCVPGGAARGVAGRLLSHAVSSPRTATLAIDPSVGLREGDPVFAEDPEAFLVTVGRVRAVRAGGDGIEAEIEVWPAHEEMLREGAAARALAVPETAAWVLATLLPAEQRERLATLALPHLRAEGAAIRELLWPQVREGLLEALLVLEEELPAALAAQGARWEALLARQREGAFRTELLPVLREVVLPIARERMTPVLEKVGAALWKALPVWSLGWRALWQEVDFSDEQLVKERFREYLRKDAEPILAAHLEEILAASTEVLRDSFAEGRFRRALAAGFGEVLSDPELSALLAELVRSTVFSNERMREVVARRWEGGLRDAVVEALSRLEPLVREAVDAVVLDDAREGINPRLARVLRARVFRKDGRFVLLAGGDGPRLPDGARIPAGGRR